MRVWAPLKNIRKINLKLEPSIFCLTAVHVQINHPEMFTKSVQGGVAMSVNLYPGSTACVSKIRNGP